MTVKNPPRDREPTKEAAIKLTLPEDGGLAPADTISLPLAPPRRRHQNNVEYFAGKQIRDDVIKQEDNLHYDEDISYTTDVPEYKPRKNKESKTETFETGIDSIIMEILAENKSVPLELPVRPPAAYRGSNKDGDPVAFVMEHYKPWLEDRVLDFQTLRNIDNRLWNALHYHYYRQPGGKEILNNIFPSAIEVRDRRSDADSVIRRVVGRNAQRRYRSQG